MCKKMGTVYKKKIYCSCHVSVFVALSDFEIITRQLNYLGDIIGLFIQG